MTKEEILERSRRENKDNDPYEQVIDNISVKFGRICSFLLCIIFTVIQLIKNEYMNFELWGVVMLGIGAEHLVKGLFIQNKKEIANGIFDLIIAAINIILAIIDQM